MSEAQACNTGCPRCGQPFRCGVDDAGPCPCTQLQLDSATLAELNRQYRGCLCLRCLAILAAPGARAAAGPAAPASD